MTDICIGCPISKSYCVFKAVRMQAVCPCLECLVKPTCKKQDCQWRWDAARDNEIESLALKGGYYFYERERL